MPRFPCLPLALVGALALSLPTEASPRRDAEGRVEIQFTGAGDSAALIRLDRRQGAAPRLEVTTRRAGVPGSLLSLHVDRSSRPLLSHALSPGECSFATGESVCTLDLSADEALFRSLVTAFDRGRVARLEIRTGGVMAMDGTASLIGFRRAWR